MAKDDDQLDDFDLSAWEAPPVAADLADAVIERMGTTDVSIVLPIDPREAPGRRRWLIAGVAAAVAVGTVGMYALVRSARPAAPTSGELVADRPRTLTLDGVVATLDAGADVRWKRRSDGLHVEQRGGVVAWRVDKDDKLMIDAAGAAPV